MAIRINAKARLRFYVQQLFERPFNIKMFGSFILMAWFYRAGPFHNPHYAIVYSQLQDNFENFVKLSVLLEKGQKKTWKNSKYNKMHFPYHCSDFFVHLKHNKWS